MITEYPHAQLKKVAIVILNWNGKTLLEKFLPGVLRLSGDTARIVVADNASDDDSVKFLQDTFPEVDIIELDANYGFTGGYNRALQHVEEPYYLLLNSDVEVTENWIQPLLDFMEKHPEVAVCQPKVRSFSDRHLLEHAGAAGGFIDILGYPFCRGRIYTTLEEDKGQYDNPIQVFWATGACMLIRKEVFRAQQGFDDYFFAHMEEIDLCWRIQLEGLSIWAVPQSCVYHVGGGTLPKINPRKTYYNFRNNLIMLFKNVPGHRLLWLMPLRLVLDGLAGMKFLFDGDAKDTWAIVKAHFAFYRYVLLHFSRRLSVQRKVKSHPAKGVYNNSIVVAYFLKKKKYFHELSPQDFS